MQAAYWVGRKTTGFLGGVAAHLYAEFDGDNISPARLRQAVRTLFETHDMLRLSVDADALPTIMPLDHRHELEIEDLRHLDAEALARALTAKRWAKSHQCLDLERGKVIDLGLSLLADGRCRLHVDMDMIAADPSNLRLVMEDLARFYADPAAGAPSPSPSYFDYRARLRADAEAAERHEQDQRWWRARIERLPPAPPLPWRTELNNAPIQSERFAAFLTVAERHGLERAARRHGLTLSILMLAVFALALGTRTKTRRFRLNVPMFYRRNCIEGVEGIVGDFSDVLIAAIDLDAGRSLLELCRAVADEIAQLLSHVAYSGISVMRDLSRRQGEAQLAPVVFTAGVNMPGGELFSERVTRSFGQMVWVISQAPQIALDAQVAAIDGGILVNWDVRLDAVPQSWVRSLFDDYLAGLRQIAHSAESMTAPLERAFPARPTAPTGPDAALTPLQRAYLIGRGGHLPLGGVAMQEFREYRGRIATERLRCRLALLVRRHDALRTHINEAELTQHIAPAPELNLPELNLPELNLPELNLPELNLEEMDLRGLSPNEARLRIDALRPDYAHRLCELSRSPWHLLLIHLPAGADDSQVLFARFDALILDGQGIAAILTDLLAEDEPTTTLAGAPEPILIDPANRQIDAAYWTETLRGISGPTRLPWRRPLQEIPASRYRRQRLVLPRADLTALTRLGARHGLFRNTILAALLLDVLTCWCEDATACVAVPVALPHGDRLGNGSSFIPLPYDASNGTLAERARRVQVSMLQGLDHLAFSGIDLNRLLLGRNPEGPALPVVLTNALAWPKLKADAPVRLHDGLTQTPQTAMDIRMSLDERDNLELSLDYAVEALSPEPVAALLAAMGRALQSVAQSQELELRAHDVFDLSHYRHNGTDEDFAAGGFLRRVAANLFDPDNDATALICGDERISYGRLGGEVAAIMHGLDRRGLGPGNVVALCLPRGPDHVTLSLACALRGIIWVPVDCGAPPERLRYLLDNCRPDLVVGRAEVAGWEMVAPSVLAHPTAARLDFDPRSLDALSHSDAPAYYLFTSGTTGKPKCVVLCNQATANVIDSTQRLWRVEACDVFISVTPLHHDMAVFDLFGALSAGATLVLPAPGEEKDALAWNRLVKRHGVTLWCSVPAILEMLLACRQGDELGSLRLIAQGGDYIKPTTITALRALLPQCRLFSLGGPTETTIWSIWHELTPEDRTIIPYGRPLPCYRYFLLNDAGAHCPPGIVGRIHTAGLGLALGYLEDGRILQKDFVTISDERGQKVRAFRTGDLGRYRDDGTLLFAGRINGYVKVRGIRVSLPDIENELARNAAIERVLVIDYGDARTGEVALGAVYVGAETPIAELRAFARRHLPETLVPSRFLRLADLPLSANGKPDRARARALLRAGIDAQPTPVSPAAPTLEQRVLDIYLAVIGAPHRSGLGDETGFLELGLLPSHLRAAATQLRQAFGVEVSPGSLARCRNARQVAALLQDVA